MFLNTCFQPDTYDKRRNLVRQTEAIQALHRIRCGIDEVRKNQIKMVLLMGLWMIVITAWAAHYILAMTRCAFYTCGLSVSKWLDCTDQLQSALNKTIVDVRYDKDNQTVQLSAAPPATKWYQNLIWYDRMISGDNFVLILGESQTEPVTIDLTSIPHVLPGGTSSSGKTVLLKVLLKQAISKYLLPILRAGQISTNGGRVSVPWVMIWTKH